MNGSNTKDIYLRIGTRSSRLAISQVDEFILSFERHFPNIHIKVIPIKTEGDIKKDVPLSQMIRGMFVREIEEALMSNRIDIAIHSAKDLPPDTIPSLKIAAMLKRVDPRDVIINKWKLPLSEIPDSAIIGTSSPRREAFIRSTRNELTVKPIRGNVETRLSKIGNGYDGVILAAAGLLRLGLSHVINEYLDTNVLIPDVGQGALAIQTRSSDKTTQDLVSVINDSPTFLSVTAERAFMRTLGGSCNMPAAAYAQIKNQTITIAGMACSYDGQTVYKDEIEGDLQFAEKIGCELATKLIGKGASKIIEEKRQ